MSEKRVMRNPKSLTVIAKIYGPAVADTIRRIMWGMVPGTNPRTICCGEQAGTVCESDHGWDDGSIQVVVVAPDQAGNADQEPVLY